RTAQGLDHAAGALDRPGGVREPGAGEVDTRGSRLRGKSFSPLRQRHFYRPFPFSYPPRYFLGCPCTILSSAQSPATLEDTMDRIGKSGFRKGVAVAVLLVALGAGQAVLQR